jgi:hypothetical protein
MDQVIALGKRHGFEMTPADVMAVRDREPARLSDAVQAFGKKLADAMAHELSDDQLDQVSAGTAVGPTTCPKPTQ